MSTFQRMTLIGLYNYDSTLFDGLVLPEGYDPVTFRDSLLLEHGEKCVMYTDPDFMRQAISLWSKKWELELERIYDALTAEYNPIWNYDRYEEVSDKEGTKYTSQTNAGHKATDSPDFSVEQTTNGINEHLVSADNSSEYQPESKDITNNGKTKTSGKTQDLAESSNSKTDDQTSHNYDHDGHMWGNIGVTTSASMVSEVVRQRFEYNLYDIAGKIFAKELLLGIY